MSERLRIRPTVERPAPAGGPSSGSGATGEQVIVGSGLFYERLPVAGLTIAEIRERFADRLDIDPASTPVVDGDTVGDENMTIGVISFL